MNEYERSQARAYQREAELLKTPEGKAALEYAKRRQEEERQRNAILDSWWGPNGYKPPMPESKPKAKTAEEMRMEDILKNFG